MCLPNWAPLDRWSSAAPPVASYTRIPATRVSRTPFPTLKFAQSRFTRSYYCSYTVVRPFCGKHTCCFVPVLFLRYTCGSNTKNSQKSSDPAVAHGNISEQLLRSPPVLLERTPWHVGFVSPIIRCWVPSEFLLDAPCMSVAV